MSSRTQFRSRVLMNIETLTQKIIEASKTRTPEQRKELLQKAGILDENGDFDKRYFSVEEDN